MNEGSNEVINSVDDKDKEIANLKIYIETLEQKLKVSGDLQ